jgi:mono/diheme cytochrome c family protein
MSFGRGTRNLGSRGVVLLVAALLSGCRQEMYDQPKYEPFEASDFFRDGLSARPLEPGTVARLDPLDQPRDQSYPRDRLGGLGELFDTGKLNGKPADEFPFPMTRDDLARGQARYRIYCTPCHGELGDGHGMIVQRGFPAPPPFYGRFAKTGKTPVSVYDDLREAPVGHFFDVMTNGHGVMYSYASRIPPADRWRIAAYLRALQLSRHTTRVELEAIPEAERAFDEKKMLEEMQR